MTVETKEIEIEKEKIVDDIKTEEIDTDKMAALKAKMAAKNKEVMPPRIVEEKKRTLNIGVVGSGQMGNRLCENFHSLGYPCVAINTAAQDLAYIKIPDELKLRLEYSMGGAAKDLSVGAAAVAENADAINQLVQDKLSGCDAILLTFSLGGGSGSGSCVNLVDIVSQMGKPIFLLCVLPMNSDDATSKANSLETLGEIAKLVQAGRVQNVILGDNSKLESIFSSIGQLDFFSVANQSLVEGLHIFNEMSSSASKLKPLDPQEFSKIMIDSQGLSVFGSMKLFDYADETAIAEGIVSNLNSNLLAEGLNLKSARYAAFIAKASSAVWNKIPAAATNYAQAIVGEATDVNLVFKGLYVDDNMKEDCVEIHSLFSGLTLPESRIEELKKEVKAKMEQGKEKDKERSFAMKVDTGVSQTVSAAEKVHQTMAKKSSAFGKFMSNTIDKRK